LEHAKPAVRSNQLAKVLFGDLSRVGGGVLVHPGGTHEAARNEAGAVDLVEHQSHQLRHEFLIVFVVLLCDGNKCFLILFLFSLCTAGFLKPPR
jgi:hypothetical protein